jgi:hypothetical protein
MADVKNEEFSEIRCQKKMKGGLSYEIILAEPVAVTHLKLPSSSRKNASVENIEEKLKAAEISRLSLEAEKKTDMATKISKIEESSKRRKEQANNFISQTRQALEQKMEAHTENRESFISDFKSRLKKHWECVEKTRMSLKCRQMKRQMQLRRSI